MFGKNDALQQSELVAASVESLCNLSFERVEVRRRACHFKMAKISPVRQTLCHFVLWQTNGSQRDHDAAVLIKPEWPHLALA